MSFLDANPGYRLDSEEQARNWVIELTEDVRAKRRECDVVFPGNQHATIEHQRKAYAAYMIKHGAALGAIMALHRCGKIGDVAYNELRQIILDTLSPTVVGVSGGIPGIRG